jgi:hypothetical protein
MQIRLWIADGFKEGGRCTELYLVPQLSGAEEHFDTEFRVTFEAEAEECLVIKAVFPTRGGLPKEDLEFSADGHSGDEPVTVGAIFFRQCS